MAVSHVYSQTVADGTATSVVRPSDWNSAHNQYLTISGNTAGQSTVSGTNVVFQGGNNVTLSQSTAAGAATVVISGPSGGGVGVSNVGNTVGSTGAVSDRVVFAGGNNITLSQSTNGQSATITISAGPVLSNYVPFQLAGSNSNFTALGLNSLHVQHMYVPGYVTMNNIELYARGTFASSTNSQVVAQTISYGIYSQGAGTNSTRMELAGSSTAQFSASYNSSTTAGLTMAAGGTTFTTGGNNTTIFTGVSGAFHLYLPFATSLAPNVKYAVGILTSSATTVGTSPWRFSGFYGIPVITPNMGRLGVTGSNAASSTVIGDYDAGIYGTTTGAMPTSYANSQLGIMVSRQKLFVQFEV